MDIPHEVISAVRAVGASQLKTTEQALAGLFPRWQVREAYRMVNRLKKRAYPGNRMPRNWRDFKPDDWDTRDLGPWTGGVTPVGQSDPEPAEASPTPAPAPQRPVAGGTLEAPDEKRRSLSGTRFVFTSAQNNTHLHTPFWDALQHFCAVQGAELYVSRFSYNKNGWENPTVDDDNDAQWYDPRIIPFILDEQVKVAAGLVFCGELDILPTAATPLMTLQNYTGPNSGIVPHVKVHMQSLATMKNDATKFMYTTGACTLRNYIDRKAGQVATFHHTFSALYVEVNDLGEWFVRQLMADDNGVFYDIDTAYGPGWNLPASEMGDSIITLGDIHIEQIDHAALGGALELLNVVKPVQVFLHDLIDFQPRNHHNLNDPFFRAHQHFHGLNSVELGMLAGARFLHGLQKLYPELGINVVRSNHDQAFERWLKDPNCVTDPANARYWHQANCAKLLAIEANTDLDVFVWAMRQSADKADLDLSRVRFVAEDESVVVNDIEYGMHGHRGPNGSRGNPKAFRQLGRKANTGHTHSAGIIDGVWTAGVLAKLDMGYNSGPSSWSHSSIITYPSGKRAIITQHRNRWRA